MSTFIEVRAARARPPQRRPPARQRILVVMTMRTSAVLFHSADSLRYQVDTAEDGQAVESVACHAPCPRELHL